MSDNTYGSFGLKRWRVSDIFGKYVKNSTLHLHLIDYWTNLHHRHRKYYWWHKTLMPKLNRQIQRKLVSCLPDIKVFFERMQDKDESISFLKILGDSKKYFQELVIWKETKEDFICQ